MKIGIRKDLCCGVQLCRQIAPDLFRFDGAGYNDSDGEEVPQDRQVLAERAAGACPESAISLS